MNKEQRKEKVENLAREYFELRIIGYGLTRKTISPRQKEIENEIARRTVPFAYWIANMYLQKVPRCGRTDLDDLAQECAMGILSALRTYNPEQGTFLTLLRTCYKHRALEKRIDNTIYIDSKIRFKIGQTINGTETSDEAIQNIARTVGRVQESEREATANRIYQTMLQRHIPIRDDLEIEDNYEDPEQQAIANQNQRRREEKVRVTIKKLSQDEQQIIFERHVNEKSYERISKELKISAEWARRKTKRASLKLKEELKKVA